jgi:hypothetical protein
MTAMKGNAMITYATVDAADVDAGMVDVDAAVVVGPV